MANLITSATPMIRNLGTDDKSTRKVPIAEIPVPQHCPKIYHFAEKGDNLPRLSSGGERDIIYGLKTFDPKSIYYNHSTIYANMFNSQGNACVYQRLIPDDATTANITIHLHISDVEQLPQFARNVDGSFELDGAGDKIPLYDGNGDALTFPGRRVAWTATHSLTDADMESELSNPTVIASVFAGGTSYPFITYNAASQGEFGNNRGISLTPLVGDDAPTDVIEALNAFMFSIQTVERDSALTSSSVIKNIYGSTGSEVSFDPEALYVPINKNMYIGEVYDTEFSNTTDASFGLQYNDVSVLKLHQTHVDNALGILHSAEEAYYAITGAIPYADFSPGSTSIHMINPLTAINSNNAPYHAIELDTVNSTVIHSKNAPIWLRNGSDGTVTDAMYEELYKRELKRYLDPNDPVQDTAVNVESVIYDTGLGITPGADGLSGKDVIPMFNALRTNTRSFVTTHVAGNDAMELSNELSLTIVLKARSQLYPESVEYGTPTMRSAVVTGTGKIRGSVYKGRVSQLYDIALKSAAYMGAGDGKWANGSDFDASPGNVISTLFDVSSEFIPPNVRKRFWANGAIYSQRYDINNWFFPGFQTVYPDDTSVLNNIFTVAAITELNTISDKAWRMFTGTANLTNAQLLSRVTQFCIDNTKGRFDNRFVIRPTAHLTPNDELRGYSWSLTWDIYAPNMKTVMTTHTEAWRIEDLQ